MVLLVHSSSRTKSLPTPRSWYASARTRKQNLAFLLKHFAAIDFPRKISTKTTEGRQVLVNDKPEALARFEQANWLDSRINAYTELDDSPNFLFIDIDTLDSSILEEILERFEDLSWKSTVLFTGSGYHIYQPVSAFDFSTMSNFNGYSNSELPKQFLRFVAEYLADNKADVNHNPSLKSCMVRVPGSINSKNGQAVTVIREWDGNRPSIVPLLGIFYSWLASKKLAERQNWNKNCCRNSSPQANKKIQWIEILLKTPLDDYRKTIVNLVLAPYFVNIRQIDFANAFAIIKGWLESCAVKRKLDFNVKYFAHRALINARKTKYNPMRLDTLKQRNPAIYEILRPGLA